jgi:hypothetical protein
MSLGDSLLKHGFSFEAVREFRQSLYRSDTVGPSAGVIRLKLGLSLGVDSDLSAAAEELRASGRVEPALSGPAQTALRSSPQSGGCSFRRATSHRRRQALAGPARAK